MGFPQEETLDTNRRDTKTIGTLSETNGRVCSLDGCFRNEQTKGKEGDPHNFESSR